VALFSLCVFALAAACNRLDVGGIARQFDAGTPRRSVAIFLGFIAFMLSVLWVGQIVYSLDLGLIVPLCMLAAIWLWRRAP
jgi:hypothetical protein